MSNTPPGTEGTELAPADGGGAPAPAGAGSDFGNMLKQILPGLRQTDVALALGVITILVWILPPLVAMWRRRRRTPELT